MVTVLIACLAPTAVMGENRTVGPTGLIVGGVAGSMLACLAGPLTVLSAARADYEGGMRSTRGALGSDARMLSIAQLSSGLGIALLSTAAVAAATLVAGVADQVGRAFIGPLASTTPWDWTLLMLIAKVLSGAAVATTVTWLLCIAFHSSTRAILSLGIAMSSWFALLFAVHHAGARPWLVVHPLAYPWQLINPIPSSALAVSAPSATYLLSAISWFTLLVVLAVPNFRRP